MSLIKSLDLTLNSQEIIGTEEHVMSHSIKSKSDCRTISMTKEPAALTSKLQGKNEDGKEVLDLKRQHLSINSFGESTKKNLLIDLEKFKYR